MQIRALLYILSCVLFGSVYSHAYADNVSLLSPPDRTVIEYDILNLSLSVPYGSADLIRVTVDGTDIKEIVPDNHVECFSVRLKPGTSTVEITVLKGEAVIETFVRNVFHRSDLVSEYRKPPRTFKRVPFHSVEHQECKECHELEMSDADKNPLSPKPMDQNKPEGNDIFATASTCSSCHSNMIQYPYVHGPASVWSCLSCHDQNADVPFSVREPVKELCYECHIEQKNDWEPKKYIHGPVNVGKCTICHSPHASENPFNLFKSTWNLCVNCHEEKGTGQHVLGDAMFKDGHPTKGRKDPIRIGKELTCASCHNPHASSFPHLWAFEVNDLFELCKKCHFDK